MRTHCNQFAMTGCLLLAVSYAPGQTQPSTTTIPRSQYDPMAAAHAQGKAQPQSTTIIPRSQYDPMAAAHAQGKAQPQSTTIIPRSQYDPIAAAQAQGQVWQQSDTWYEFFLKRINPTDFDYGACFEERRRAFLEASVTNPYFWYSFWVTIWAVLASTAYAKRCIDQAREQNLTDEMMADLYNHDQYSREATREAIDKYNRHIEQCNRVIEAAESGRPLVASGSEAEPTANSQQLADQLTAITRERDKLQGELGEKSRIITDLSLRVEAVSRKTNGNGDATVGPEIQAGSTAGQSDSARLMSHINYLQQQLYAERQKNKRLKGA
ncbi:MAG: hypothetical protein ACYDA9_20415 [Terriglobia bacterium]